MKYFFLSVKRGIKEPREVCADVGFIPLPSNIFNSVPALNVLNTVAQPFKALPPTITLLPSTTTRQSGVFFNATSLLKSLGIIKPP